MVAGAFLSWLYHLLLTRAAGYHLDIYHLSNEINTDIRSAQPICSEVKGSVLVGETGRERLSENDRSMKYLQ